MFNCLNDIALQYLQTLLFWNAPLSAMYYNTYINFTTTKDLYLFLISYNFGEKTRYYSRCCSQYAPCSWKNFYMT